jgi:hypothetical protein
MRTRYLGLAALLGGLALAGCSSSSPTNKDAMVLPDTGEDGGLPGNDASEDAGTTDTGFFMDSGIPPGPCPANTEGCQCTSTATASGTCTDTTDFCITWSSTNSSAQHAAPPSCLKPCMSDSDCTAGGRTKNLLCRDLGFQNFKVCVAQEADQGQVGNRSQRKGRMMTGCKAGLSCIGVSGVDDDQCSCGQTCFKTAANPTGGCSGTYGSCNPAIFQTGTGTSAVTTGICSKVLLRPGNFCHTGDITQQCDSTNDGTNTGNGCVGFSATTDFGICMEFCNLHGPATECTEVDPKLGRAKCKAIDVNQPTAAVCQLDCSNFPETCGEGTNGGPPPANRSCLAGITFDQMTPVNLCVDIIQPTLAETVFAQSMGMPAVKTMGGNCQATDQAQFQCPVDTFCAPIGMAGQMKGICIRGCSTSTAPANVAIKGGCNSIMAGTSTSIACTGGVFTSTALGVCTQ